MPANKATPKASITLLEKADDKWKFAHSPSGAADFSVKQKVGKQVTLGIGFTDGTVRKIKSIPGLVLSADLQARDDVKLSVAHNLSSKAAKFGIAYDTRVADKKTTFKVNYLTSGRRINGEVISSLAANKKATVAFENKQVTNVKIALIDGIWTYEPSYNLVKHAPSLAISRPAHGGKYKVGWNLKTDDMSLEYHYRALKFAALKSPTQNIPRIAASVEHDFEF
eukprot:GHRR01000801.1.p1 GENE.GHRR01000801.1~~GHRR01000801.1.p1  ORF type:complete len:224 (+),score=75.87 GHRR01000801.1:2107-2778(+)